MRYVVLLSLLMPVTAAAQSAGPAEQVEQLRRDFEQLGQDIQRERGGAAKVVRARKAVHDAAVARHKAAARMVDGGLAEREAEDRQQALRDALSSAMNTVSDTFSEALPRDLADPLAGLLTLQWLMLLF